MPGFGPALLLRLTDVSSGPGNSTGYTVCPAKSKSAQKILRCANLQTLILGLRAMFFRPRGERATIPNAWEGGLPFTRQHTLNIRMVRSSFVSTGPRLGSMKSETVMIRSVLTPAALSMLLISSVEACL